MTLETLDRRTFLAAGGGLVIGFAAAGGGAQAKATGEAGTTLAAYLTIAADGAVTIWSPTTEMGQGTHTAHAAIIADELGIGLERVSVRHPHPAAPFRRGQGPFGSIMSSAGSWGVRAWIAPLRKAGAQARAVLVQAAAARWGVPATDVDIRNHELVHVGGRRRMQFGAAAVLAASLPLPEDPPLRPASAWRHQGRDVPRLDIPAKVRGEPIYAADVRLPDMLIAAASLAPVFRAERESHDAAAALAVPGVSQVVALPNGAAVIARDSWSALRGAAALNQTFRLTGKEGEDSAAISALMRAGLSADGEARVGKREGDVDAALAAAARVHEATFEVPYLSHTPMEPWSCTARFTADGLEVWAPTQGQDGVLRAAAEAAGLPPERVVVHTCMPGGGFGLRLTSDGVAAAVLCAKAAGKPVKLIWSRETEFANGRYRPAMMARLRAGLDAQGRITALHFRTCGHSLAADIGGMPRDGVPDWAGLQNMADVRYGWGAHLYDNVIRQMGPTTAAWRAVGATHNAFFVECFMDELAALAGQDPIAFRLAHLADGSPRQRRARTVIEAVRDAAGAAGPAPAGRVRGFSYFESYGALCAQIAEVSLQNGAPRVHRVWCALDAGTVVMPDQARQQVEGGVMQGLSAALYERATIAGGRAQELNFTAYRIARIEDAPEVETLFINSGETIGGVGEPPTPPIFAAVANAVSQLKGAPVRSLPLA
jgi:isoquinoline 1-oxidoreductase beta subunit